MDWIPLREGFTIKSCCSFGFCPNYTPPPFPPIWTTCTAFSDVKFQDFKVRLGLKILNIHYPQWGGGRLFHGSTVFFFTKTAVTQERKSEKSLPRWEMSGLSEGYKRVVDQNWGRMPNIGFFGQIPRLWAQKNIHFWTLTMFWP